MIIAARVLLPFLKPYRGRMLIVLVSILVVAGAGLLAPCLIARWCRALRWRRPTRQRR
ncbi:MAG: hypothetical protein HC828_08745 [Blastochloris sp.]|nr:hypothetical protein [Blastochloris sp.]